MMKNTAAFFALVAGALACAGLVLTLLSYVAVYFFLQGVDSMVSPQIDTLSAAVSDSQQTVSDAADAAGSASVAIANITHSLSAYAGASDSIGATLSSFSQNQLLSALAPQIADSVSKLNDASSSMREAATALNSTSASAGAAAASPSSLQLGCSRFRSSYLTIPTSFRKSQPKPRSSLRNSAQGKI